jgi:hypothetical protein
MSFTSQNLLDMAEALASGVENVATIDWVMPSPIRFGGKAAFFATVDAENDTKTEIETTLVRAAQIRFSDYELLGDEETNREIDDPIIAVNFECTIFHERKLERLDEAEPLDDFEKRIRKSNHEHVTALFGVVGEFQGVNAIPALNAFPEAETVTPVQADATELDVECDFIAGVIGDQSKLQLQIRVQLPC